jgi:hypothetical protein
VSLGKRKNTARATSMMSLEKKEARARTRDGGIVNKISSSLQDVPGEDRDQSED